MQDYQRLLKQSEARLKLIEENVRDYAMFVVDPAGKIASWNVGAERILGYSESEAIGMNCSQIFTPEDRAKGAVEYERSTAAASGRAEDERWHLRKDGSRFWGNGVMTALRDQSNEMLGFVKILRDETERKSSAEKQALAQERRIAQESRNAVLQERNRLAQEIHDTLAQSFTAINIQLEAAKDVLTQGSDEVLDRINKAQGIARAGLAEARRSVWALRPQILEDNNLVAAFTRLADDTRARAGLAVICSIEGLPVELEPGVEDHLLRIGQEAVTNALRHANATELKIMLHFGADDVCIRVEDDGTGFDTERQRKGFGLTIMRERTQSLGARLEIASRPGGGGTKLEVHIPVKVPKQTEATADAYGPA